MTVVSTAGIATLRLRGFEASRARCLIGGREVAGPALRIQAPAVPAVIEVVCRSADAVARAQVTVTEAARVSNLDPYTGGVVLFKTRRNPRLDQGRSDGHETGLRALDALLAHLDASTRPVFMFDGERTRDRVGLDHWLAIELPRHVNFFQAVRLLRSCRDLYAESYLPRDRRFLPESARTTALASAETGVSGPSTFDPAPDVRNSETFRRELERLGVPEARNVATGRGVAIALGGVQNDSLLIEQALDVESGPLLAVAPDALVLPVGLQEAPEGVGDPSARALAVVQAVAEGARLLTCAWSPGPAYWLLHDALQYAEDNCVLPVCAADVSDTADPGYPSRWRRSWLDARELGTGNVFDVWEDREIEDFFQRPLAATLLVGAMEDTADPGMSEAVPRPDLRLPITRRQPVQRRIPAASSRKNASAWGDPGSPSGGPRVAVSLVAGVAALVLESRPDLDPWELRAAILAGLGSERQLEAPRALEAVSRVPAGYCADLGDRLERARVAAQRPWWSRVRVRTSLEGPAEVPVSRPWDPSMPGRDPGEVD